MRLSQIRDIFQMAIPLLRINSGQVTISGSNYWEIRNVRELKRGIDLISRTESFPQETNWLKDNVVYISGQDSIHVGVGEGKQYVEHINKLRELAESTVSMLSTLIGDDEENVIYVKLPNVTDFDGLAEHSSKFQLILSQTILHSEIGGKIEILGAENGSIWIKLKIGSPQAMILIASMAWAAAVIHKKTQEGRLIEQLVRTQEITNEHRKKVSDAYDIILDAYVKNETQHIMDTSFPKNRNDNELFQRVKNSLTMLSQELEKGAEINPSLLTPEEVSNLFPDVKQLQSIESRIKTLPKNKEE